MQAANDNRSPAEYRAIVSSNPEPTNRLHKGTKRPTAARLLAENCPHMVVALNDWAALQALPAVTVANDNWVDAEDAEDAAAPTFDNLMTTQSARLTIKLHKEGEPWRPTEERFDTPRRNDRTKAAPPNGSYRNNGIDLPTLPDAEAEMIRKIDASNMRLSLGHVCARLLDLASGDSTRAEIAAAVKQPDTDRIDVYTDWAIVNYMREAA